MVPMLLPRAKYALIVKVTKNSPNSPFARNSRYFLFQRFARIMTWIEWFCSLKGNECLCEVPCKFICMFLNLLFHTLADPTNYYGLDKIVPNYKSAFKVLVGEITRFNSILLYISRKKEYRSNWGWCHYIILFIPSALHFFRRWIIWYGILV